jgi:hypothetical protein
MGWIDVTAEAWETEPPLTPDNWQDIADVTVPWNSRAMEIWGTGGEEIPLRIAGPGVYRLRVCARHRDDGEDRSKTDPIETVLIQIWSTDDPHAANAGSLTHKATSKVGRYWRSRI